MLEENTRFYLVFPHKYMKVFALNRLKQFQKFPNKLDYDMMIASGQDTTEIEAYFEDLEYPSKIKKWNWLKNVIYHYIDQEMNPNREENDLGYLKFNTVSITNSKTLMQTFQSLFNGFDYTLVFHREGYPSQPAFDFKDLFKLFRERFPVFIDFRNISIFNHIGHVPIIVNCSTTDVNEYTKLFLPFKENFEDEPTFLDDEYCETEIKLSRIEEQYTLNRVIDNTQYINSYFNCLNIQIDHQYNAFKSKIKMYSSMDDYGCLQIIHDIQEFLTPVKIINKTIIDRFINVVFSKKQGLEFIEKFCERASTPSCHFIPVVSQSAIFAFCSKKEDNLESGIKLLYEKIQKYVQNCNPGSGDVEKIEEGDQKQLDTSKFDMEEGGGELEKDDNNGDGDGDEYSYDEKEGGRVKKAEYLKQLNENYRKKIVKKIDKEKVIEEFKEAENQQYILINCMHSIPVQILVKQITSIVK